MSIEVLSPPPSIRATFVGGIAIILWATLALLTTMSGKIPPFQLLSLSFGIAFALTLGKWSARREPIGLYLRQPLGAWLLGIGGFFGYHFFYFVAMRHAPAVDASLIAYLWPLLIVVFSAALPGERIRWWHMVGALCGLAGTALLVVQRGALSFQSEFLLGYGAALGCALTWSLYSVLNRRYAHIPTDMVGGVCGIVALLGVLCHLGFETTIWPHGGEWLAILGLGIGPVGLAFFVWDHGTKHGDIRLLGVFSYGAPLLSTLLLLAFGKAAATWQVVAACILIVGGALLASAEILRRVRR